jgi:hypothetical protein
VTPERDSESVALTAAALHPLEPVEEVARKILAGEAFADLDAVRVAAAFLDLHEKQTT